MYTKKIVLVGVMITTLFSSLSSGASWFSRGFDLRKVLRDENAVALARAVGRGDIRGMERAVAAGADVNVIGDEGFTPLLYALYKKNLKAYTWLLEHGANPNVGFSPKKYSIVSLAAKQEDITYLRLALDHGGDPNWEDADSFYKYPLFHAIMERLDEHAKLLVEKGADVNAFGSMNETPIRCCVGRANFPLALFLLDSGADLSRKQGKSHDALHGVEASATWYATMLTEVQREYVAFVEELRRRGYTVNVSYGRSREELLRESSSSARP